MTSLARHALASIASIASIVRATPLLALASLAFACGGASSAANMERRPSGPTEGSRAASSSRSSVSAPSGLVPAPSPSSPCAPERARATRIQSRTGSSIALVDDGAHRLLYLADEDNHAIHTVDAEDPRELAITLLPGAPAQILPLPDGRLLVSLRDKNRLLALEPGQRPEDPLSTRCERATYTEPFGLALSTDHARVALTTGWDHKLMLFNAQDLSTERVIDLPPEPRGVLLSEDKDSIYVSHLHGGIVSHASLSRADEPPRRIFVRAPKPEILEKSSKAPPSEAELMQAFAAAQGFAITELSLGKDEHGEAWPARIFVPMAGSDPMLFGAAQSFPGVYGGGSAHRAAAISAFVAVIDPVSKNPLGAEAATIREARPEDCILPRALVPYKHDLLVACMGTNRLLRFDTRAADPISAQQDIFGTGAGPTGVAVDEGRDTAFVLSSWDMQLEIIDLSESAKNVRRTLRLAVPRTPALSPELARGRELFHVTRDVRLSFDGRACASCHPDGRSDGLTWATPDGARQSISLAGRVEGSAPYGWFGDHVGIKNHVLFTIPRLGGLGFHTPSEVKELDALLAYVRSLRLPSREGALVDEDAERLRARGRELFYAEETACSTCHIGDGSDGKRHDVGSGNVIEKRLAFDTPSLRGVAGSAPYFHDGRYATLMDLLSDPKSKMGRSADLPLEDRRALAAYLESL